METNEERRTRKLTELCATKGLAKVAKEAHLNPASLDQIIKGVPLPARKDGKVSPRSLGADAARAIEEAFDLGRGWFDWPFEGVDYKAYWNLDKVGQGIAQERMMQAVRERQPMTPEEDEAEAAAGRQALKKNPPRPVAPTKPPTAQRHRK